ncbi:hypothetical protein [Streptomyces ficellus]|uniref:Uncharacterized protein n=1 Tax=Streptomyces ficellus TaxID=1977088 RepID=A0A6I6FM30_9ACTN|nr:hypothetical protein [Streptomyces ficellus]QGV77306.1 hypothetical protein EIZ62_02825 [Streptomyces ficellus]
MNEPAASESGCQMMKRIAQELKASIRAFEAHAEELSRRIAELEAQPDPEVELEILALVQARDALEKKIEEERASLSTLEDVIRENC